MSFQTGLSGLNASSKTLEAIGNNIANASTAGFKSASASFSDVYAASLSGSGTGNVGIGTQVAQIAQRFTQGNVSATGNSLDMAINGGGFFRMEHNGTVSYGRNGQFQLDKDGFIVSPIGARLTGYVANASGVLSTGAPAALQISATDLPPAITTEVAAQLNLDSRATAPVLPFDSTNPATYNNATSVDVFDSLGNSHVLQTFYVKTAANTWDIYGTYDDGTTTVDTAPALIGSITFDATGAIATPPLPATFATTLTVTTGGGTVPLTIDWSGTTQFGSSFSVNALSQDGYSSGRLAGFTTSSTGVLSGRYTNGQTAVLGQVVLANFRNPNGLQALGNNEWVETSDSGAPLVGTPNSGSLGTLQSSAIEESNVDLTAELVNMITAQRVYQANAQTIKTQDQVLQTLVNLR